MLLKLFLLLTVVPLVELMILLRIGAWLGWLPTLGLVVATGLLGAILTRREGLKAVSRINQELDRGEMPTSAMADGVLILLAGVVLITPGVLTDICGFALLIPPMRRWIKRRLARYWRGRIVVHGLNFDDPDATHDDFVDVTGTSTPAEESQEVESSRSRDDKARFIGR